MKRIVNVVLILATAAGLVQLVRGQIKLSHVQAEHQRLREKYGSLDVLDSDQYLVRRVETDDPMHFLWMVHYPSGLHIDKRFAIGGSISSSSSMHASAGEFLLRCRFELSDHSLSVHQLGRGGSSRHNFNHQDVFPFVRDHWNELEFSVLAEQGTRQIHSDKLMPMLTVRIPESLHQELIEKVGAEIAKQYIDNPLIQLTYGTPQAFQEHGQPK